MSTTKREQRIVLRPIVRMKSITTNRMKKMSSTSSTTSESESIIHNTVRNSTAHDLYSNYICTMFDELLNELERMEKSNEVTANIFSDAIEQMVDAVLTIKPYKLLESYVLNHPLIHFLQQKLMEVLDRWHSSDWRLNIHDTDIFLKIVLVFVHADEQAPAELDRIRIREVLITRHLLDLVVEKIDDIVINKQGINDDPNICTLGLFTMNLLKESAFYDNIEENQRLIDDIVMNSLDSFDCIQSIRQLQKGAVLTDIDRFLLFTCWKYVPFISADDRGNDKSITYVALVHGIYEDLLTRLERALDEPIPVIPFALSYILERFVQLISIRNLHSFDRHAPIIVNLLTKMLKTISSNGDRTLLIIILNTFHKLSKNSHIRLLMKQYHLNIFFMKLSTSKMKAVQNIVFAILAQIMDEQDVKDKPSEVTAVFIDQLKQLDQKGGEIENLDNIMSSLKVLMQHEQIKNELIKQDGLQMLISFLRDGDSTTQTIHQQRDALEILWLCTFDNPEVINLLKQDNRFMERVNELLSKAIQNKNDKLQKAADGLIWKVEKEEKFKEKQVVEAEKKRLEKKQKVEVEGKTDGNEDEEEFEQYDMMVSYSWADMDLAHRIFHHLTKDLGYKVWLDQEQMHGSTIEAMANAIENAQFIVMCMSETYKRSANCKSEAEYAFNRKKHIVPLKMTRSYAPDGWLGFILGTRMYIDFGNYEFDKAMNLLNNEIKLQKKKRKTTRDTAEAENSASTTVNTNAAAVTNVSAVDVTSAVLITDHSTVSDDEKLKTDCIVSNVIVPKNISNWDETMVQKFLTEENISAMIPLCDGINGEELLILYSMCKTNSSSMYRSLKFELAHSHRRLLPISTYLHFISRMRQVCGDDQAFNMQPFSISTHSGKLHLDHLHDED